MPANNYTYADGRPTVAAIIPLYNGARFIEQAIKSVLEQTLPTHECVVVDDGSTDEGPAILEKLGKTLPIRVLHKRNGGQSSARNFGVAHTTSEFIAFLDQDDVWYPDHLATLIAPFIAQRDNHRLGWCYGDLDEGDEDGHTLTRNFLRTRTARHPKTSVPDCAREDMFVLPSASLIARHAFEAVGGFDERLSGYEDDDLFIRLLDSGFDNVFVDDPVLMWRIYAFSTSYSPRMVRSRMIYARKLLETYGDRLDNDGRRLATSAIAPRFAKALFGEYGRAGRRGDDAAMDQALDDLRGLIGPQLPVLPRLATQVAVTLFRYHPLGRVVTQGGLGIARKVFRWPVDHRAASLQAQADKPRG